MSKWQRSVTVWVCLVGAVLFLASGVAPATYAADEAAWIDYSQAPHPSSSYLDRLMNDLRSESFAVRLEAQRRVLDLGPIAVARLVHEVEKSQGEERELKDAVWKSWTAVAPIMAEELQRTGYPGGRWLAEGYLWRINRDFRQMYSGGRTPSEDEFEEAARKCQEWLAEYKATVASQEKAVEGGLEVAFSCDNPKAQSLVSVRFTVQNRSSNRAVVLDTIRCINPEVTTVLEPEWQGEARYTGPAGGPTEVKDMILMPGMTTDGKVVITASDVPSESLAFVLWCRIVPFDELREKCIVLGPGRTIADRPVPPVSYSDSELASAARSRDLVWRESEFIVHPFATSLDLTGDVLTSAAARAKAGISAECHEFFSGYYSAWVFEAPDKTVVVPNAGPAVVLSDMIKLGVFARVDAAAAKGESEITLQAGANAALNLGVKLRKEGPMAVFTSSLVNLIDDLKKVSASPDLNKVRKQNEIIH